MSARIMTVSLVGCTGLLLVLTTAPAHAGPSVCPGNTEPVTVAAFNDEFEGPLWSPVPQERLDTVDRNDDGVLCAFIVTPRSSPPGLGIPEGEMNVLVVFQDNPRGLG